VTSVFRNNRVLFMLVAVALCIAVIALKGLTFGVDFGGGTLFQIHLAEKVTDSATKEQIRSIIQQRLDFSGMKDSSVQVIGSELVFAQLAETDPKQIEKLESVLLKQGKFEAMIDGNVIFSGDEFVDISKDPGKGYGVSNVGNSFKWTVPFTLSEKAAKRFSEMTFHRCAKTGFDTATNKVTYECDYTYFFLDRPVDSVLVIPEEVFQKDSEALSAGNLKRNIVPGTKIDDVLKNSGIPYLVIDANGFSQEQLSSLQELSSTRRFAVIPSGFKDMSNELKSLGFTVSEVVAPSDLPWVWFATGLKEVIRLTEGVTNLEPYVASLQDPSLKVYSSLYIEGGAASNNEATQDLKSLTILLESGSLPVAVDNVSKVTVTASLGKSFLWTVVLIGFFAAIAVAGVLFFRYRITMLVIPMMFTVFAEAILTLGIASIFSWPLDLASIAGVIAAIGYGVNDQIVITDELKKHKGEAAESMSLVNRAKRAFFIVMAAASTVIAVMLPLLIIGPSAGMARLVGFAFTTIIGVLVGVLITRPAFQEIAKSVISKAAQTA